MRPRTLAEALARRDQLGGECMYRMCHGLDHDEQLRLLCVAEASIGHCWPKVYAEQFVEWARRDGGCIHNPDVNPRPDCPYCETTWIANAA